MASPSLRCVLILDSASGARIHAKYYGNELRDPKKQLEFEQNLFGRSKSSFSRSDTDIVMCDGSICVFKSGYDVMFYVCGSMQENELILVTVLETIYDALNAVLRSHLDRKTILDNLDMLLLTVDETVDGGLILETDPSAVSDRVLMKGMVETHEMPAEISIAQASQTARDTFTKWFRS